MRDTVRAIVEATSTWSSRLPTQMTWTIADVEAPARLRLYVAAVDEQFVLSDGDRRISVSL